MKRICFLLLLTSCVSQCISPLWAATTFGPAPFEVSGVVRGADGRPTPVADVYLSKLNGSHRAPLASIRASSIGAFTLQIPEAGPYRLWVTAPNHDTLGIPINLEPGDTQMRLEITLTPAHRRPSLSGVQIVGDWNNFDPKTAEPMRKIAGGKFVYERKAAGKFGYQLVGVSADQSKIPGTMADEYRFDGDQYVSIVHAKGAKVRIVFDPSLLPRAKANLLPTVKFDQNHASEAALLEIERRFTTGVDQYEDAYGKYLENPHSQTLFFFDFGPLVTYLEHNMREGATQFIKEFAALHLVKLFDGYVKPDSSRAGEIARLVTPQSRLWSLDGRSLTCLVRGLEPDQRKVLLDRVLEKNPDRQIQGMALLALTREAYLSKNDDLYHSLFADLKNRFWDLKTLRFEISLLNPNNRIVRGKPVPDFEIPLLATNETVSNKSLSGKFYLIDFWGTWCGPCVGEMPGLHRAYEKFKDRNFTILSVACPLGPDDKGPDAVTQFRAKSWPMPWLNTFLKGGQESKMAQDFEVSIFGFPRTLLVNAKGEIIAVQDELRGESLAPTLDKLLPKR